MTRQLLARARARLSRIASSKFLPSRQAREARAARGSRAPGQHAEPLWIDLHPDNMPDLTPGAEARYEASESSSLAFVAALQHLPPTQRAALILRDVVGFPAAEAAYILDCTVSTADDLVERARASMARQFPPPGTPPSGPPPPRTPPDHPTSPLPDAPD